MTISPEENKWRIESDARTLKKSELIKADEKRYKAASKLLEKELKAMQRVTLEQEASKRFPNSFGKKG